MLDSPELYAPRDDAPTPVEAAAQRAAKSSGGATEAAARVIAEALAAYVLATLDPHTVAPRVVAAVFAGNAATAAREILRAWVGWCSNATAVRIAAASTPMGGAAAGEARAVLTNASETAVMLVGAHASCDRDGAEGDPAALARLDARDRAIAAWVALATGRGPSELAGNLPAATMHPRTATALAAPVLSALAAWERDARRMLAAAEAEAAKPPRAPLPLPVQGTPWPSPPLAEAVRAEASACPHNGAAEALAAPDASDAALALARTRALRAEGLEAAARGDVAAWRASAEGIGREINAALDRLDADAAAVAEVLRGAAKGDA